MVWILISIGILILDQITKYQIINTVGFNESISIIDGFLSIRHVNNSGAAFGFFQGGVYIFIPITIIISVFVIYFIYYSRHWLYSISLCFMLGGAWGNLVDRIFRGGAVVDFLDFKVGTVEFWVLNIADVFLIVGTLLLAYYLLFLYDSRKIFSKYKL